jgi:hypothetical protein
VHVVTKVCQWQQRFFNLHFYIMQFLQRFYNFNKDFTIIPKFFRYALAGMYIYTYIVEWHRLRLIRLHRADWLSDVILSG